MIHKISFTDFRISQKVAHFWIQFILYTMVGQVARTQRGLSSKRGHQHHGPRFEGNRISRVDPTDIIAALRDVDRMPVTMLEQICYEPIGQAENLISAESRNANEKVSIVRFFLIF